MRVVASAPLFPPSAPSPLGSHFKKKPTAATPPCVRTRTYYIYRWQNKPSSPSQVLCPHFSVKIFAGVVRIRYICPRNIAQNLNFTPMAKVRIPINPLQVGRVGAYSMYVRNGEQIVRQRNNSSNYGDSASRTEAQMLRRVKWANLVNFYKASAFWMPKAFENKKYNQTMYNAFMAANINLSTVALTKQLAEEGCCVCEALQVSKGTLPSLSYQYFESSHYLGTGLQTNAAITGTTTVGELSAGIIATMRDFQNGDNIAWVKYVQTLNRDSEQNLHPRLLCFYEELTLDTSSSILLSAHPLAKFFETVGTNFNIQVGDATDLAEDSFGYALIHTRRDSSLKVSSQLVAMISDSLSEQFTGQAWLQDCIDSYGVDSEVPLDPSFKSAVIQKVLWNGSVIYQKGVTSGRFNFDDTEGGELEIQGTGLNSRDVKLHFFNGSESVEYTPLEVAEGSWKYILTANGIYTLVGNKYVLGSLELSDIEPPTGFPTRILMMQKNNTLSTETQGSFKNITSVQSGVCINYNHVAETDWPNFLVSFTLSDASIGDIEFVNCTANANDQFEDRFRINLTPTDPTSVAYVKYEGVIVAVFNYS